ncbi:MAG: DNA polymerase III subunit alpha [Bacteroidales bacterium]|nr:DNA polymerase III subunit alpha [Bacteroidales bacterium]
MSNFTHLHVHTQYSILDGLATIPELIKKAYADGQRAMAVTDHGNMFGIFTFVKEVEKFNSELPKDAEKFKAIIGCEVYVARHSRFSKSTKEDRSGHHLILLARNMDGYRNLSRLVSLGYIEGEYYKPRIDKEIMRKYSEGIICCSACLGGELPQVIMRSNPSLHDGTLPVSFNLDAADKVVEEFKSIYGSNYYLELQRNGHKEQKLVNAAIMELAAKHHVKVIASNDVHFVNQEDFNTHKMLICINTGKDFTESDGVATDDLDDNGMAYSGEEYFRTTAEMEELFSDIPEAITNTQEIVRKVETFSLAHAPTLPRFVVPQGFKDDADYLRYLTWEGAKERWGENLSDEIKERLEFELKTVCDMKFPGYFLIVLDFIEAGKKNGIRFGPGRGSAAGSAIAYCLHITNIDPIKYDLLFERFLNPDRISMPDMDIDMDGQGREKTIQYVSEKYGKEKVAVIITLMEMKAKTAIRDCARVLKLPISESNRLAKLVPDKDSNNKPIKSLQQAIDLVPELKKELEEGSELVRKTLKYAVKLDGSIRGTGVHACGVIIGRDNLFDCIPLSTSKNSETMVTQYEGSLVEEAGLLKMDFLGLKTLDIITEALKNIKKSKKQDINIDNISLEDEKTYELFCEGDMTAVFQFESPGMRKYLRELKPTRFEDIIAMVSLYRPGPMDNIPTFIRRKQGLEKITYPIPEMGKILDDTYGITVYQEQVMLLSRMLAGFTRGQADTLRKAMGKKKIKLMEELNGKFIAGGTEHGYDKANLDKIWEEWKKFAEYAFNKSHATCYAYVSYQTAWLKANFMAEFLAANLTLEINDIKRVSILVEEATAHNIPVLPPDVNESDIDFTVDKNGAIRFGLAALKGVGTSAIADLVEERNKNGKFKNIFDFMDRINLRSCNRRVIESMASVGAFDSFGNIHRAQFFYEEDGRTFVERLINYGSKNQEGTAKGQFSIFDDAPAEVSASSLPTIPECEPWSAYEKLMHEKEIAGFYISGHPLDEFKPILKSFTNTDLSVVADQSNWIKHTNHTLSFAVMVTNSNERIGKSGNPFGIVTFEDYVGSFEWMLFGEDWSKYKHLFSKSRSLLVKARVTERGFARDIKDKRFMLKPVDIIYLQDAYIKTCKAVRMRLNINDLSENLANIIKDTVEKSNNKAKKTEKEFGKTPLLFSITANNNEFSTDFSNYEMKVDPETFIKTLPYYLRECVSLE